MPRAASTQIVVEAGAGMAASIPDADYRPPGARSAPPPTRSAADIVLKVRGPTGDELGAAQVAARVLVGLLESLRRRRASRRARKAGVTGFALESLPRISRAQAMDVLSSQANIAGYKAVIIARERVRHASCRC